MNTFMTILEKVLEFFGNCNQRMEDHVRFILRRPKPAEVTAIVTFEDGIITTNYSDGKSFSFLFDDVFSIYVFETNDFFGMTVSFSFEFADDTAYTFYEAIPGVAELGEKLEELHGIKFDYDVPKKPKLLYKKPESVSEQ